MPIHELCELMGFYPSDEKAFLRRFPDEPPQDATKKGMLQMDEEIKKLNYRVVQMQRQMQDMKYQSERDAFELKRLADLARANEGTIKELNATIYTQRLTIKRMRERLAELEEQEEEDATEPQPMQQKRVSRFAQRLRERYVY